MTDAKKAIATLRYFVQKATKWNEGADELARAEGVYGALDHIDTLTRERDEARRTSQYWKDEKLASESAIDTLTRERDAARDAFDTVISLAPVYCERLHHTKKDYHESGEPCPVEARIKTLIQITQGDA
jgi:hypothetical protein